MLLLGFVWATEVQAQIRDLFLLLTEQSVLMAVRGFWVQWDYIFATDTSLSLRETPLLYLIDESDTESLFPWINEVLLIRSDLHFGTSRFHVKGIALRFSLDLTNTFPFSFWALIISTFIHYFSLYVTLITCEPKRPDFLILYTDGIELKNKHVTVFSGKVWVLQRGRQHQGQNRPQDGGRCWESQAAQTRRHHHWTHLW